jgi:hypothetical protein
MIFAQKLIKLLACQTSQNKKNTLYTLLFSVKNYVFNALPLPANKDIFLVSGLFQNLYRKTIKEYWSKTFS